MVTETVGEGICLDDLLIKAGSFVAIIILGFVLRKVGFCKESDFHILSKIVLNITLPAAIVTSFSGREFDLALLAVILLGFGGAVLNMLVGYLTTLRQSKEQKAFEVLNMQGYNVGNFAMPFIQSFFGPMGVITCGLFDTGNAFLSLGGAYSIAAMIKDGSGFDIKRLLKTLVKSFPFMTYVVMLTLNLTNITLPGAVLNFASVIGSANTFLAMFMIGIGFKIRGDRSQIGRIVKILALRYGIATVLALIYYFVLPFGIEVRQALVILAFSPFANAVPAYTAELKGDVGLSSAINSIGCVISVSIYLILLPILL